MDVRQLFKNLKKEAECPLCLDTLNDPKTLPCLHSFCLVCIDKHAHFARRQLQTTISCPVCLTCFQIPEADTFAGLPASFHLNRLVDVLALGDANSEVQKCSSCEGEKNATCYCFDCHDFFCDVCVKVHNKMKLSRGHRNVLFQNLQSQDVEELIRRPVMCKEKYHEKETLEYYCQECKRCICHKCGLLNHKRHDMLDIQEAAEEQKMQIMACLDKVKTRVTACEEEITKATELLQKSKEEMVAAQNKISTTIDELVRSLREHEADMISKLNDTYETQKKDHATQQKKIELFTTQLKSSLEYSEAILKRNIASEVLKEKDSVLRRFDKLLTAEQIQFSKCQHIAYLTNVKNMLNLRGENLGHVICSWTDPLLSVAYGNGLQVAEVDKETQFTIETNDSEQKLCYCKDQVTVSIKTAAGEELETKIEDSKNGKYSVTYTPDCAGQHDVVITVNGEPLAGCPWRVQVNPHQYQTVFQFGSPGTGQGQLDLPCGIAVSKRTGNVAVADPGNQRIQMFSPEGKYITEFGQKGPGAEILGRTISVAFTLSGDVIVSHITLGDQPNKLLIFSESGQFIGQITNRHLKDPYSVSVGSDGQLIVCECDDKTIKVVSSDGTDLLQSFTAPDCAKSPRFAVYHQDKFFVSYYPAHCVKVFNREGVFLYNIGSEGSGDGQFRDPDGLAIDRFNQLIVCDNEHSRLQVFTLDGQFVTTIEGQHTGLDRPCSVALSNDGKIFVTDEGKHCVHVFQ